MRRERDDAVLAAHAPGDADPAGVEVDVGEPDPDELGDPDPGVEQGLDQDDVSGAAGAWRRISARASITGWHARLPVRNSRTSSSLISPRR